MANTVKAYKNANGNLIIDCGVISGKHIQYVVTDNAAVQVEGTLLTTDFSNMEEQYWDSFILGTLSNAKIYSQEARYLSSDEVDQLIILANEKSEDFD